MATVDGPPEPMMMPVRSLTMFAGFEAGIADRLIHGDVVPGHAGVHEALRLARHHRFPVELRLAVNLALEAELGVFLRSGNAGFCLPQRGDHFLG